MCLSFHRAVPSLESMLVNALKMRPDVKSVHMGCMACAAGALGINLVQDLLKVTSQGVLSLPSNEIESLTAKLGPLCGLVLVEGGREGR
jgi:predicted naringenin-chalcone synthase